MKVGDFYSGAGGLSLGLKQAGVPVTLAVDCWADALASHAANHLEAEHLKADILGLDPTTLGRFDWVVGGPPCPSFSYANKNRDPRKGMVLVNKFLAIVRETRPKVWFLENVPPAADHLPSWIPVIRILDAVEYGTPQFRQRVFAGRYTVPLPTYNQGPQAVVQQRLDGTVMRLKPWITVVEALGLNGFIERGRGESQGHPQHPTSEPTLAVTGYDGGHTGLLYDGLNAGGKRTVNAPSYTIRAKSTQHRLAVLNGAGCPASPVRLEEPSPTITDQGHAPDFGSEKGRQYLEKARATPAPTIVGGHREGIGGSRDRAVIESMGFRRLSPDECAALMGFPPDYIFLGSKTSIYKQIGNAICPPMARAIAAATLAAETKD